MELAIRNVAMIPASAASMTIRPSELPMAGREGVPHQSPAVAVGSADDSSAAVDER